MKLKLLTGVLFCLLLSTVATHAQDAGDPLSLADESRPASVGKFLDLLNDPSGQLTIDQVASPELAARWTHSDEEIPNFGFTQAAIWARLQLKNDSTEHDWQLLLDQISLDNVDLYLPAADGSGYVVKRAGTTQPVATRDARDPNTIFDVTVPEGAEKTIYLRAKTSDSLYLPLSLWTERALSQYLAQQRLLYGIVYGALATMIIYHFFLFLSLRDRVYLLLVAYLLAQILVSIASNGWGSFYLWPGYPQIRPAIVALATGLEVISWILFTMAFLETRTRTPRLHQVFKVLVVLAAAAVALLPLAGSRAAAVGVLLIVIPGLVAVLLAGIAAWRQGYRPARYFVVAQFVPYAVGLVSVLALLGQAPVPPGLRFAPNVSLLILVLLLSFALADRIQLLKTNVEQANRSLGAKEHRLAEYLEAMPFGVAVYDAQQAPVYINRAAARFLAIDTRPETWTSNLMDGLRLTKADSGESYPTEELPLQWALRGENAHVDDIVIDANGSRVEAEIWSRPLYAENGTIEGAITTILDLGRRRMAEAELAAYRTHLEELVRLRTAAEHHQREVAQALQEIASALTSALDQPTVLQVILEQLQQVTEYEGAMVALVDDHRLEVVDVSGAFAAALGQSIPLVQDPMSVDGLLAAQARLTSRLRSDAPQERDGNVLALSEVSVPLISERKAIGVLTVASAQSEQPHQEDRALLQAFANQAATAVTSARLYRQAQEAATVKERERLARELHDAVTQTLFSASLIAEAIPIQIHHDPAGAAENLDKLRQLTRGALAEMRTLLLELRPAALMEANLDVLIRQLAEGFTGRSRVPVFLTIEGEPGSNLPPDVRITFYRVAQEAFNNIMKHAHASQVDLALRYRSDQAMLLMDDNGKGFVSDGLHETGRMGLHIMRERAQSINAQLDVQSQPGNGVSLSLRWKG